jgi:hypothetical protein
LPSTVRLSGALVSTQSRRSVMRRSSLPSPTLVSHSSTQARCSSGPSSVCAPASDCSMPLVAMIWRLRRSPTSPSMRISTSSSRNITSPMASTLDNSGNLMFEPPRVTTRSSMPALGVGTMRSVWRV